MLGTEGGGNGLFARDVASGRQNDCRYHVPYTCHMQASHTPTCISNVNYPCASTHTSHTYHPHASPMPHTHSHGGERIRSKRATPPSQDTTAPTSEPVLACVLCWGQDLISSSLGTLQDECEAIPLQTQSQPGRQGMTCPESPSVPVAQLPRFLTGQAQTGVSGGQWICKISFIIFSAP